MSQSVSSLSYSSPTIPVVCLVKNYTEYSFGPSMKQATVALLVLAYVLLLSMFSKQLVMIQRRPLWKSHIDEINKSSLYFQISVSDFECNAESDRFLCKIASAHVVTTKRVKPGYRRLPINPSFQAAPPSDQSDPSIQKHRAMIQTSSQYYT